MHKLLVAALLILVRGSESLTLQRRALFKAAVTAASVTTAGAANAVPAFLEGVPIEREPGRAPNQPASGPLANSPFGFKVGGGARPEEEVRKIDEGRYRAARGPEKGPSFLDGVPRAGPSFLDGVAREPLPEKR